MPGVVRTEHINRRVSDKPRCRKGDEQVAPSNSTTDASERREQNGTFSGDFADIGRAAESRIRYALPLKRVERLYGNGAGRKAGFASWRTPDSCDCLAGSDHVSYILAANHRIPHFIPPTMSTWCPGRSQGTRKPHDVSTQAAVFLDRDGVLIEDRELLADPAEIRVLDGVGAAIGALKDAGFRLVVVSNQAVVARGLITEQEVDTIHHRMQTLIRQAGGPELDAVCFCPHHPEATVPEYRCVCPCRKPRPGMLLRAAEEHDLDLKASFMVGDRMTDIMAGAAAGCRTVLVQTGRHNDPPIITIDPPDPSCQPDYTCPDLRAAAEWIIQQS